MKRYFYISDDLDDLEHVEEELESAGVSTPQIHVLSTQDAEVASHHHLHEVESILKQDVVGGTMRGAAIGALAAVLVLGVAAVTQWHTTVTWIPFAFLAIIAFGFCTWEGGLFGLRQPNANFKKFQDILDQGRHLFFVDITSKQEEVLRHVVAHHPRLTLAGTGPATPEFVIQSQEQWNKFVKWAP